eukprot:gene45629-55846_t
MPVLVTRPPSKSPPCWTYGVLIALGIFIVISTFLSLELHEASQGGIANALHDGDKILRLSKRTADFTQRISNYTHLLTDRLAHQVHLLPQHPFSTKKDDDDTPPETPAAMQDAKQPKAAEAPSTEDPAQCSLRFESKCEISPLVQYWDEIMDCYVSPLREHVGLAAPVKDR